MVITALAEMRATLRGSFFAGQAPSPTEPIERFYSFR
jgi:hypothetical protein